MHVLVLRRHGPKNNDPQAHATGVEALLDPRGIKQIIQAAALELNVLPLLGSMVNAPDGRVINLSPAGMSALWKDAKVKGAERETACVAAWCNAAFDNTWDDTGISLREIAARAGAFVLHTLQEFEALTEPAYRVGFGHSGDLEFFLYWVLAEAAGISNITPEVLLRYLDETGGALAPLQGYVITEDRGDVRLSYLDESAPLTVDIGIFEKQAAWLAEHAIASTIAARKAMAQLK